MIAVQFMDQIARATREVQTFPGFARFIVTLATVSVLTAVFINFQLARRSRAIRDRRKSVVETGSMLAFFAGFYLLIRLRIGVFSLPALYYPLAVAGLLLVVLGAAVNIMGRCALAELGKPGHHL